MLRSDQPLDHQIQKKLYFHQLHAESELHQKMHFQSNHSEHRHQGYSESVGEDDVAYYSEDDRIRKRQECLIAIDTGSQ